MGYLIYKSPPAKNGTMSSLSKRKKKEREKITENETIYDGLSDEAPLATKPIAKQWRSQN